MSGSLNRVTLIINFGNDRDVGCPAAVKAENEVNGNSTGCVRP